MDESQYSPQRASSTQSSGHGETGQTFTGRRSDTNACLRNEARRLVQAFSQGQDSGTEISREEFRRPYTGRSSSDQATITSKPPTSQHSDIEALNPIYSRQPNPSVFGILLNSSAPRPSDKKPFSAILLPAHIPDRGQHEHGSRSTATSQQSPVPPKSAPYALFPPTEKPPCTTTDLTALPNSQPLGTTVRSLGSVSDSVASEITDTLARRAYILKLCSLLLSYGAPTHRVEGYLAQSSRHLGIDADFLYLPSVVICTFHNHVAYGGNNNNNIEIVRQPAGIDVGRIEDVADAFRQVVHGELTAQQGLAALDAIASRPHLDGAVTHIIFFGLAAASISPLAFDANLLDFTWVVPRVTHFSNVFEVFACISISFVARAIGSITWPGGQSSDSDKKYYVFCFSAMTQSSIVLILPGIAIMTAALELQAKHLVSGSVRMTWSIIYTLFLAFGLMLGTTIFGLIKPDAVDEVTCVNPEWFTPSEERLDYKIIYTRFIWAPIFACCVSRIYRAKWRRVPMMALIATVGNQVQFWIATQLASNAHISNTVGSFVIGCLGNIYGRFSRHSGLAAAAMMPAIFLQVPGTLASAGGLVTGVASSRQMLTNDTTVSIVVEATRGILAAETDPDSVYSGTIF